jgi:nitroreductase
VERSQILDVIKNRRTVIRFETTAIDEEKIRSILEAARWAPSWLNSQPWRFIKVTDPEIKQQLSELVPTIYNLGSKEAPIHIIVCVNPEEDPFHYVEDGAAATQNLVLAAQSLGLGTMWIGVHGSSAEEKIKRLLKVPEKWKIISTIPVGIPKYAKEKDRKELSQLINTDFFHS